MPVGKVYFYCMSKSKSTNNSTEKVKKQKIDLELVSFIFCMIFE